MVARSSGQRTAAYSAAGALAAPAALAASARGGPHPPESRHGRLIPLVDWSSHHRWPTEAALRYYVFHEKTNGFDQVVRRVGRRVLLDEDAFFEWAGKLKDEPQR